MQSQMARAQQSLGGGRQEESVVRRGKGEAKHSMVAKAVRKCSGTMTLCLWHWKRRTRGWRFFGNQSANKAHQDQNTHKFAINIAHNI